MHDLAAAAPDLDRSFKVVNLLLDTLAYNPPGKEEGYLFWVAWANHLGNQLFTTQDAHGPIRRGLFVTDLPGRAGARPGRAVATRCSAC